MQAFSLRRVCHCLVVLAVIIDKEINLAGVKVGHVYLCQVAGNTV